MNQFDIARVVTPVAAFFAAVSPAFAQAVSPQPELPKLDPTPAHIAADPSLGQVRSVNQLQDVKPTDWAYQALRSLRERYGCIAGYPDSTFRGNRAMTRYEFAAGLNACLDKVNELIASATADLATQEDLKVLQRLQDEFKAELATLRGRVDALESRTAQLEANQFSTTTKLSGEVIFGLQQHFGKNNGVGSGAGGKTADNAAFGDRVRLSLNTSFTGKDLLLTRISAGNIADNTNQLEMAYTTPANGFVLDKLFYSFPVGKKAQVTVGPWLETEDILPTIGWQYNGFANFFEGAWTTYDNMNEQGGLGGYYKFNKHINIAAAYVAGDTSGFGLSNPSTGLFKDSNTALVQLSGNVGKFEGTLAYIHAYDKNTGTNPLYENIGTNNANDPFGSIPATRDEVGISGKYKVSSRFIVSIFGSYARLRNTITHNKANVYSVAIAGVFPDLFRKGNEGGIGIGVPPTVSSVSGAAVAKDGKTPFMLDTYYTFALGDHIFVTPGGYLLINGGSQNNSSPIGVAAIKTKFLF